MPEQGISVGQAVSRSDKERGPYIRGMEISPALDEISTSVPRVSRAPKKQPITSFYAQDLDGRLKAYQANKLTQLGPPLGRPQIDAEMRKFMSQRVHGIAVLTLARLQS